MCWWLELHRYPLNYSFINFTLSSNEYGRAKFKTFFVKILYIPNYGAKLNLYFVARNKRHSVSSPKE